MRRSPLIALMLMSACTPKSPAVTLVSVPQTPAPAVTPVVPVPAPAVDDAPPPANAHLSVTITFADGTTRGGQVVRIDRSRDVYGATGWTDDPAQHLVSLSRDGHSRDVSWDDIVDIDIQYPSDPRSISCEYDSSVTPWIYTCTLPTTTTATTRDGDAWPVTTRHLWRWTFDDGAEVSFHLFKLPVQRADDSGRRGGENYALYGALQGEVMTASSQAITHITVQ